jgi:cation-transporting ATPase E
LAAVATMTSYGIARAEDVTQIEARTTATITLFIVAMWVLAILARPFTWWRFELVGAMAGLFVLALLVPWSRHFFALNMARPVVTATAVGIAAAASALLELAWRLSGWMRPPDEVPAGHASTPRS